MPTWNCKVKSGHYLVFRKAKMSYKRHRRHSQTSNFIHAVRCHYAWIYFSQRWKLSETWINKTHLLFRLSQKWNFLILTSYSCPAHIYRLSFSFSFRFSILRVSWSQNSRFFPCEATFLCVVRQIFIEMHWFQKKTPSWPSAKFLSASTISFGYCIFFLSQ